ncbi:MAG: hypothetical protein ABJP02_04835 [Parasphingorhabdus sp.]|uniref:hypothetical protein n=1 Tax=Parasphingorhabdus sp. TaxID=2709688 RepID=UPI003297A5AB
MPHKIDAATAGTAGVMATTPAWLPSAQDAVGMATHPVWGELLGFMGVVWLVLQCGWFIFDKWRKYHAEDE